MNCFFNELSFSVATTSFDKILPNLKQLNKIRMLTQQYNHVLYIHRDNLYNSTICNLPFRQALNNTLSLEEKRKIFSLLDHSTPALPEDSAIPNECGFFFLEENIANSGLAECAYRVYMDEDSLVYSLECQQYSMSPLKIDFICADKWNIVDINNVISVSGLQSELEKREPELQSWQDILQRSTRLSYVSIEKSAEESLQREPYEVSLGRIVWKRLLAIEEMASSSGNVYYELIAKYCHGDQALFSDESQTRINDLAEKLYFMIDDKKKLCSFHGKIRHRHFRIHMDRKPEPGQKCHVAYIGRKII